VLSEAPPVAVALEDESDVAPPASEPAPEPEVVRDATAASSAAAEPDEKLVQAARPTKLKKAKKSDTASKRKKKSDKPEKKKSAKNKGRNADDAH